MKLRALVPCATFVIAGLVPAGCTSDLTAILALEEMGVAAAAGGQEATPVSGSAVFFSSTEIVHSQQSVPGGMIQRSSVIVKLMGDLSGYVLFHPTSVFDFTNGTLVNTGTQIFSGTVAGSEPVILADGEFRFEIDLATGATTGNVHLSRSGDSPTKGAWYDCRLSTVSTGTTAQGDVTSNYTGECVSRGKAK